MSYGGAVPARTSAPGRQNNAIKDMTERAAALFAAGSYVELEQLSLEWIERFPANSAKGWDLLGLARFKLNRLEEAESALLMGLRVDSTHLDLWDRLGVVRNAAGRFGEAHEANLKALALGPQAPFVINNAAVNLVDAGRYDEALALVARALKINARDHLALLTQGNAFVGMGRLDDGIASYRKVVSIAPDWPDGWNNLGGALNKRGLSDDAVTAFRQALALNPDQAESWSNLGGIFRERKQEQEALDCFNQAIDLKPDLAGAYINMGGLLHLSGRQAAALDYFEHARKLDPLDPMIYMGMGSCYQDLSRFDEAVVSYCTALELVPGFDIGFSNLLFALNYHPTLSAEEIFKVYQQFEEINTLIPLGSWKAHGNDRDPDRRLRIGYVSPDFQVHAVQNFLEPLLAHHDKSNVEVFGYADLAAPDWMTDRYRGYADHWCVVNAMNDQELADQIRADGIDILVDLAGHTAKNRLKAFSLKPAPVQVSWMGFGSTTGMTAIDYFLADGVMMPQGCEPFLAETPWRLPHAGFVYRPPASFPQPKPLPALRTGHVTFGSLSRAIRLNNELIAVWAELLTRVPGSRLVINSRDFRNVEMQDWMRSRFSALGIDLSRLDVGYDTPAWLPMAHIDVMLDCFPHNSGTTLIEGLYSGLPVVTLAHRPTVGRLGASLLSAIGHPEWIGADVEGYLRIAEDLAADVPKLAHIRATLRDDVVNSAAMDEEGFCRDVEQGYREMWQRYCAKN